MKNYLPILLICALALTAAMTTSCGKDDTEEPTVEPKKEYSITVASSAGGSAAATVGGNPAAKAAEGAVVTLSATPDEGYILTGWTVIEGGGLTLTGNPVSFKMPSAEVSVRAEFEKEIINVLDKITDPGFKYYCELMEFDADKDGVLTVEEARAVTEINVSEWHKVFQKIESLAGIEYFTSITSLKCYGNNISSLDLSKNTLLTELNVATNRLVELDVTNNTKLTALSFGRNLIERIDLSKCPELENLQFYESDFLTTLDVSANPKLKEIVARLCPKLTTLVFANNPALENLYCYSCGLTSIDVSKCPALKILYCFGNRLTAIDVTKNTALEILSCEDNLLTGLDVSKNTVLTTLYCQRNRMSTLDASAMASPNDYTLGCGVQTVDGTTPQPMSLTLREEQKAYWEVYMTVWQDMNANVELANGGADVLAAMSDQTFRTYCERFDADGDGKLSTAEAAAVTEISVPNMGIESLDGINYFTGLKKLICNNNKIASLSVIKNEQLTDLVCNDNGMTEIDVNYSNGGRLLVNLDCQNNKLKKLSVASCRSLEKLNCQNNELREINFNGAVSIKSVNCMNNKLEYIWWFEKSTKLQSFTCSNNSLTKLDLSGKPYLTSVMCNNCLLTELNISGCTSLKGVMAFENRLERLDASPMITTSYNLFCGNQTSDGTTPRTLTLTLREEQIPHWNSVMKDSSLNANVVLAE